MFQFPTPQILAFFFIFPRTANGLFEKLLIACPKEEFMNMKASAFLENRMGKIWLATHKNRVVAINRHSHVTCMRKLMSAGVPLVESPDAFALSERIL